MTPDDFPTERFVLMAGLLALALASIASTRTNATPQNPSQQPDVFNSQGQPQAPLQGGAQQGVGTPDAIHCLWNALQMVGSSLQTWQTVIAPGWNGAFACHTRAERPRLESCWDPLLQAKSKMEQAERLYERARQPPPEAARQFNAQARRLNFAAKNNFDTASDCYWAAQKAQSSAASRNNGKLTLVEEQNEALISQFLDISRQATDLRDRYLTDPNPTARCEQLASQLGQAIELPGKVQLQIEAEQYKQGLFGVPDSRLPALNAALSQSLSRMKQLMPMFQNQCSSH